MERSKVRPADNLRCFVLARFFLDYFLLLRAKSASKSENQNAEEGLELGLVGEMVEVETVRWIVMRMKYSIEDKVDCSSMRLQLTSAPSLERTAREYRGLHADSMSTVFLPTNDLMSVVADRRHGSFERRRRYRSGQYTTREAILQR